MRGAKLPMRLQRQDFSAWDRSTAGSLIRASWCGGGQVSVLEPTLLLLRRMPRWGRDTTIASLPEYTSLR